MAGADQAARLFPPAGVDHRIRWDFALPILGMHFLAMSACVPWLFSWTGLAVLIVGISLFGLMGITICYHRLLTHRSFRVPKWLERCFAMLAICCAQETPAKWVSIARS